MSLIKQANETFHGRSISFADPDHEPGAVEREGAARAAAAGRHFNGTQALLQDVAPYFDASIRTWEKGHNSWDKETYAELKFPPLTTKNGNTLLVRITHDSYRGYGYVLSVQPKHLRADGAFVKDQETSSKISSVVSHDWEKATGKELHAIDVRIPLDSNSRDMYHRSIEIRVSAPDEFVPTAKYIKGLESILDSLKMYL